MFHFISGHLNTPPPYCMHENPKCCTFRSFNFFPTAHCSKTNLERLRLKVVFQHDNTTLSLKQSYRRVVYSITGTTAKTASASLALLTDGNGGSGMREPVAQKKAPFDSKQNKPFWQPEFNTVLQPLQLSLNTTATPICIGKPRAWHELQLTGQ